MYGIFMESWVILKNYKGAGWIFILYLLALIYLLITEKNKKIRSLMLYTPIAVLLVFLCPIFRKIYVRLLNEGVTYYRILWIVPVSVTVGYGFCHAIYQISEMAGKKLGEKKELIGWIGAAFAAVLIVLSGKFVYNSQYISKAENAYHLPEEVIEICEMIKPKEGEIPLVYATFPGDLVYYVRQYDTSICLSYGRDMVEPVWGYYNDIYEAIEGAETIDAKNLLEITRSKGAATSRYIILRDSKPIDIPLEDLGLSLVGTAGQYKVYEDPVAAKMIEEIYKDIEF